MKQGTDEEQRAGFELKLGKSLVVGTERGRRLEQSSEWLAVADGLEAPYLQEQQNSMPDLWSTGNGFWSGCAST